MASGTHSGGKTPAPSPIARKSLFEKSRCDTSLGILTQRFAELLKCSANGVLDLNEVSQQLNAPKRRVYDVTNVLEGIQLIKKKSKNCIEWLGGKLKVQVCQDLQDLIEEERKLDELIQSCTQQVRHMCEDRHCQRYPLSGNSSWLHFALCCWKSVFYFLLEWWE
uniref:E2F/DP family winged-helix DNA-binding domain-containing protein n=1 Tax=Anabas testudineus TaxID=64144 RepID=A0A3Q1HRL9_ANATE